MSAPVKRKQPDSAEPEPAAKKLVATASISSAPVRYNISKPAPIIPQSPIMPAPPVQPFREEKYQIDQNPGNLKLYGAKAPSYQQALAKVDGRKTEYVFPHLAPNKGQYMQDGLNKRYFRKAATDSWEDTTLADWPDDDHRIFVGDLGNEVNDDVLLKAFATKYTSVLRARVIRDKKSGKTRGYGFVSFSDPNEFTKAVKEMNGKYIGNRPCKLKKSRWKEREDTERIVKEPKPAYFPLQK